jgi:hypothetical protein
MSGQDSTSSAPAAPVMRHGSVSELDQTNISEMKA